MLSICFDDDHEWWTSSYVFKRLFLSALEHGQIPPSLEEWQHVAAANGGLSFSDDEQDIMCELMTGLRAAAIAELTRLGDVDLQTEEGTYKVSLEKLLVATEMSGIVSVVGVLFSSGRDWSVANWVVRGFFRDCQPFLTDAPLLAPEMKLCFESETDTLDLRSADVRELRELSLLVKLVISENERLQGSKFHQRSLFPVYMQKLEELRQRVTENLAQAR